MKILTVRRVSRVGAYSMVFGRHVTPAVSGVVITAEEPDGWSYSYSRRDGQISWSVDSKFTPAGLPVFVNGELSMLSLQAPASVQVELDRAATEVPALVGDLDLAQEDLL